MYIYIEIMLHIVIAIINVKDADQHMDERDRLFSIRAGNISGWVLGFGVLIIASHTLMNDLSSLWIANLLLFAVFVSQVVSGKYSPSLEVAFKIAETFSVTLDKVFQYQGGK